MEVLQIKNLTKYYGKIKALDDLSLTIEKGHVYGLLGPNGSGKTTTLGIILGVLGGYTGHYQWFNGQYDPKHRVKIGSILETPNFYPYLNADENLKIVAKIKGVSDVAYDKLLDKVKLLDRRSSKFMTYSLGMKQRLAIAATLIGNPEVLIFDEPTNGLDPEGIYEVREILQSIAQQGNTVIMASHILDEVEKICSHVAIIKKGRLLANGPIGQILSNKILLEIGADDLDKVRQFFSSLEGAEIHRSNPTYLEGIIDPMYKAAQINQLAIDQGLILSHLVLKKQKLEQEFLNITSQNV